MGGYDFGFSSTRRRPVRWAVVVALLCAIVPRVGSAQMKIEDVRLHCDLPRCERDNEVARLLSLADIRPGLSFDQSLLDRAVFFLQKTGFFAADGVTAEAEMTSYGSVIVDIHTVGRVFIRRVEIDPGDALESEVEARVFLRSGQAYSNDPEELTQQEEAIRQLFVRDGYTGTTVSVVPIQVSDYLVDLRIRVDQGERLDVQRIHFKGHEALNYHRLRSILLDEFGLLRTYRESAFRKGVDEVVRTYREMGHIRARVTEHIAVPRPETGGVDLFVGVREGPRWDFAFEGNRVLSEDELRENLPFEEIGYIDAAEIERSARALEALYLTEGYYFCEVLARQEAIEEDLTTVRYLISEGPQTEIKEVRFEGNTHISTDELWSQVALMGFGTPRSGGFLQPAQLEADIRKVEALYRSRGFLWAHVPRWTMVADDGGQSLYVTIFINEGPRTTVRSVDFVGNDVVSDDELLENLSLRPGAAFDLEALQADLGSVSRIYDRRGYQPDVQSACITEGHEVTCGEYGIPDDCLTFSPETCTSRVRGDLRIEECARLREDPACYVPWTETIDAFDIEHRLDEGRLIEVGEIFIQGNYQTEEAVLRRELPLSEGAPYSGDMLLQGQANIRSLGLFDSVTLTTIGLNPRERYTRDRVGIVVSVEEAPSQYFEIRVGLASQSTVDNEFLVLASTEFAYVDRNTFGQAIELRAVPSFELDLTNPARVADGEFIGRAEISLFDPRFYFWNLTNSPWELQTSLWYVWDLLSAPLNQRDATFSVQVLREFTETEGLFFSIEGKTSFVQTRTGVDEAFQNALIVQVSPILTFDRRDHPFNPSRGFRTELRLDLADDLLPTGDAYSRVTMSGSHFISLGPGFVLGYHAHFGFALGGLFSGFRLNENPDQNLEDRLLLPQSERFALGGVANLRGYPDNGLGPTTGQGRPTYGDVLLNGSVELRFPLVPSIDLFGAYFVDVGQLQADFFDFDVADFRLSTGLGIRYLAFGLLPVVLDYGLALNRRVGESIGQLHFNVGYAF